MIKKWWNNLDWIQRETIVKWSIFVISFIIVIIIDIMLQPFHDEIALAITLMWIVAMTLMSQWEL